jgi:hypothetical protein
MKHLRFDRSGKEMKELAPHLFTPTGLLGEEWFVRSYWLINTQVGTGWGGWAGAASQSPAGRILCFADDRYFGYGREKVASGPAGHKLDTYQLFAQTSGPKMASAAPGAKGAAKGKAKTAGQGGREYAWTEPFPVTVRAMVLASDRLVVAGVPDLGEKASEGLWFQNPTQALDAFEGRKGGVVCLVSAADGKTLTRCQLDQPPVFDGMSAADGRIFISLKNGTVICLGGR